MNMKRVSSIWAVAGIALGMLALAGPPVDGQAAQQPVNNFAKLFANSTGQYGYEELVRASDILKNAPVWQELESPASDGTPTLSVRRRVVVDPVVRSAMEML